MATEIGEAKQEETSEHEETSEESEVPHTEAIRQARRLLHRRFKVGVSDGRLFVGRLHCLDKQGNIILYDTTVIRQAGADASSKEGGGGAAPSRAFLDQRGLGLVLIPSKHRISCHVECTPEDRSDILSLRGAEGDDGVIL